VITAILFFATIVNSLSQLHYLILHDSDLTLPPAVLGMLYCLLLRQPKLLQHFLLLSILTPYYITMLAVGILIALQTCCQLSVRKH
jgi:hypothetical protein